MAVNEAEPERMFARLQKEWGNTFCLQPPIEYDMSGDCPC